MIRLKTKTAIFEILKKPVMKTFNYFKTITFLFVSILAFNVQAQDFPDLDKSPLDIASFPSNYKVSDKLVKVIYSRPQLKGREVSKLAPKGLVWRTGANEATEVVLYKNMTIGKTLVKAGSYALFTIPGESEWTVILNTDTNIWGAYTYDQSKDVVRLKVPVQESKKFLEAFSMVFEETPTGADLNIGWGNTLIAVPFTK